MALVAAATIGGIVNFIGSAAALVFAVGVVILVALGFARALYKGI